MKLFYFQHPFYDNVGDDLNCWMWQELLPGLLDDDSETQLVGIGTLLNDRLPKARRTLVFGSGVGYGDGLPSMDNGWRVYCVRGPLSAERLGLAPQTAVTDGAALLRTLRTLPNRKTRYRFSYMPHAEFSYGAGGSWETICQDIGFGYISATWSFERILNALAETDVLITEAMHGAIIADTFRVPWVAAQSNPIINHFKWEDWTRSVQLDYQPHPLTSMWEYPKFRRAWLRYTSEKPQWKRMRENRAQLKQIAETARPQLSQETVLESLVEELTSRLGQLKADATTMVKIPPGMAVLSSR